MSNIIEISELELNDHNSMKSTNFGDGIELLMNNNTKKSGVSNNIHLEDVEDLNDELNNLVLETDKLFNENVAPPNKYNESTSNSSGHTANVHFQNDYKPANDLGRSTYNQQNGGNTQSWDGFSKINNVSFNPDKSYGDSKKNDDDNSAAEKHVYLKKLEKLAEKGVKVREFSKESSLFEIKTEFDSIMEEKSKSNSIKFQGNVLMTMINGIEYLNNKIDPFDIKLDGWCDQFSENIEDYDDVFGQLYEKYKDRAKIEPEVKLLFQLGGSAMMIHVTNSLLKTQIPGMDDILRQNPDFVKSFQTAAANTISQSNTGFGNFMTNMFNEKQEPVQQQTNYNMNGNMNGNMNTRPEMKGPSDISNILSGLKTKNINLSEPLNERSMGDSSTISIGELKEIQGNVIPARSKRRTKSSNSISLDI